MSRPFSPRNSSPASFVRVNGKIRAREVRVIGVDGKQLGVIPLTDALNLARQHGVDLVEIAATAVPPVCRLVDFGKFRYELAKKEKESKKHQHASTVKEVQLSPRIDPHDLGIKLTHAIDFLCEDMKVKVALKFRGREMAHTEVGFAGHQKISRRNRALRPSGFSAETDRPRHQRDDQPAAAQQARQKSARRRKGTRPTRRKKIITKQFRADAGKKPKFPSPPSRSPTASTTRSQNWKSNSRVRANADLVRARTD